MARIQYGQSQPFEQSYVSIGGQNSTYQTSYSFDYRTQPKNEQNKVAVSATVNQTGSPVSNQRVGDSRPGVSTLT